MKILVINSGSSSIKYRLFDMTAGTVLASGLVEQIGALNLAQINPENARGIALEQVYVDSPSAPIPLNRPRFQHNCTVQKRLTWMPKRMHPKPIGYVS